MSNMQLGAIIDNGYHKPNIKTNVEVYIKKHYKPIFELKCWESATIYVLKCCTKKEIANFSQLSVKTIEKHIQECYNLMNNEEQHCQLGLAKFMVKHGLIKVEEIFPSYKVT